jgi:hypothetical protein
VFFDQFGIEAVPSRYLDCAVAWAAAEYYGAQGSVRARLGDVKHVQWIGDDRDLVPAVWDLGDIERLACNGSPVGITPTGRELFIDPKVCWRAAAAGRRVKGGPETHSTKQQVNRLAGA